VQPREHSSELLRSTVRSAVGAVCVRTSHENPEGWEVTAPTLAAAMRRCPVADSAIT
jgi:hypothetical protein